MQAASFLTASSQFSQQQRQAQASLSWKGAQGEPAPGTRPREERQLDLWEGGWGRVWLAAFARRSHLGSSALLFGALVCSSVVQLYVVGTFLTVLGAVLGSSWFWEQVSAGRQGQEGSKGIKGARRSRPC